MNRDELNGPDFGGCISFDLALSASVRPSELDHETILHIVSCPRCSALTRAVAREVDDVHLTDLQLVDYETRPELLTKTMVAHMQVDRCERCGVRLQSSPIRGMVALRTSRRPVFEALAALWERLRVASQEMLPVPLSPVAVRSATGQSNVLEDGANLLQDVGLGRLVQLTNEAGVAHVRIPVSAEDARFQLIALASDSHVSEMAEVSVAGDVLSASVVWPFPESPNTLVLAQPMR